MTFTVLRSQVSLWTHLQSYTRSAYAEKTVLLDPVLAKDVADAIAEKSERGPDTRVFMDADGGCCDVTRRLLERGVFPEAKASANWEASFVTIPLKTGSYS